MQMPRFVLDAGNSWRFLAAYSSNSTSKPITLRDIPIWFVMTMVVIIASVEPTCLISINAASFKRGKLPINAPWTASAKSAS
ncbi:hypothetical protein HED48_05355 [Ochrobactrum intermedium]|nr:hypothetical protein [Brucella intermedia]